MGTIECSQPASNSSWDSQDFGDISMVLKMVHFQNGPPGHDELIIFVEIVLYAWAVPRKASR